MWCSRCDVTFKKGLEHKCVQPDMVNSPAHYMQGKIEVIDFLEDQKLEPHEWQVVRYVCRSKHKDNRIQDLEKARWYLDRKIKLLKGELDG